MVKRFTYRVKNNFITGVAVILPVLLTVLILSWFIGKVNSWVLEPFAKRVEPFFDSPYLFYLIEWGFLLLVFITIVLIGAATKILLIKQFFGMGEKIIFKVPIINKLYTSFKDVSSLFLGDKAKLFKKVVLLEYPRKGLYTVGLVTAEHIDRESIGRPGSPCTKGLDKDMGDDVASVFIPTSPNPTNGFFLLAPERDLIETDLSLEDALRIIISGGASTNMRNNTDDHRAQPSHRI